MESSKSKYKSKVKEKISTIEMKPIDVFPEDKPQVSETGKIWLKAFEKASPKQQYRLIQERQQELPTKPARDLDIEKQSEPMQRMKNEEYRKLLKEKMKYLREKTA